MKKYLGIVLALVLALGFSLVPAVPVLAWDVEDPCVAATEDFDVGVGIDYINPPQQFPFLMEIHLGGDGYNLYRDDVSGTGNLDKIFVAWDLPPEGWTELETLGESLDTWYWATEPRGYNFPTKADILSDSGIPGKGLEEAPGLQKSFNPNSQAGNNAGKK